jgi:phospholipid/cholesterol/gamma-HCH transport system substrate-binding protein
MRRNQKRGLSFFQIGLIAIALTVVVTYLGFTKSIPFRSHFEIKAEFPTSNNLRPNSFVRIAGVNVGKVVSVSSRRVPGRTQPVAVATLRIEKNGLPIHKDARLRIRPRIFLEGNFFVDVEPGTPGTPDVKDGDTIPFTQTSTPVQLDQILTSLQSDSRSDLRTLLQQYATGLSGPGAIGFQRSIKYWKQAYRDSARVNQATLGLEPHDLSSYVRDAGTVAKAIDASPEQLKALVTDFNTTAAAFASQQVALEQTIAELPRTLRAAQPALGALNAAFPPVRRLIADLRPAVRSSGPALDAGIPFAKQARQLVSQPELRGLVAALRPTVPALVRLNRATVPLLGQVRQASSCQNQIILPWSEETVPDQNFKPPQYPKLPIYQEAVKYLPGIAGESRSGDANGQWFKVLAANGSNVYQVAPGVVGSTNLPILGSNPPKSPQPPLRSHVPCETQERSNLSTIPGPAPQRITRGHVDPARMAELKLNAIEWLRQKLIYEGFGRFLVRQGFEPLTDNEKKELLDGSNLQAIAGAGLKVPARLAPKGAGK